MSTILAFISITLLSFGIVHAQQDSFGSTLTYDEAIMRARTYNPELRARTSATRASRAAVREAQTGLVPRVELNYDLQRNLIIPTTPIPGNALDPNGDPNVITPVKFATGWTSTAGVLASFTVFDPATYGAVEEREIRSRLDGTEEKITETDIVTEAGLAYTDVVIAHEQLKLAAQDTLNAFRAYTVVRDQHDVGRRTIIELNTAQIELDAAATRYHDAGRVLRSAEQRLLYRVGTDVSGTVMPQLTDSLPALYQRFQSIPEAPYNDSLSATFEKYSQQAELTSAQKHYTSMGFVPTITLTGFYGANYFNNILMLGNPDAWYGNSYLQLSVKVPLTNAFERSYTVSKLSSQLEVDRALLESSMNKRRYDLERAKADHRFYREDVQRKRSTMELTQRSFEEALRQAEQGRLLASELSQAEFTAKQATTEYLRSIYNLIQAALTIQRITRS
ncbi:MAG: TolC family protein [Ignavibacteria bacterium]|nr:TolC family protein [Ignavibacteria bacterium]MBK7033863.1 TolC family protein [Ignavibacteria bacterium]MBK7186645.1 TolC family protein [Ignavibacteria bacterium]MBK7576196.1 TolC family protein [Ignavibacteria bacterium]MBK9182361.1 TolC family protein [Ignavibacteria bacterium]